jgi:hypothetical protein
MQTRNKKTVKSVQDFTVPIDTSQFKPSPDDCFGKEYNPTAIECSGCADNEVCAIILGKSLPKRAKEIQAEPYLDEADMTLVTDELLTKFCKKNNGKEVSLLVNYVMETSKFYDTKAATIRIKEFKELGFLKVKGGLIVWNG